MERSESSVIISQEGGLTLVLFEASDTPGVLVARLEGSQFSAEVRVDGHPTFPVLGRLDHFLLRVGDCSVGEELQWTAIGDDFNLCALLQEEDDILLRIYMGSTSDDDCNWLVNATILLPRETYRQAVQHAERVLRGLG